MTVLRLALPHRLFGRAAQCSAAGSKMLGFIFFDFFSNLGGTGCRRGRTPERPLRQPPQGLAPKVWLIARPFVVSRPFRSF